MPYIRLLIDEIEAPRYRKCSYSPLVHCVEVTGAQEAAEDQKAAEYRKAAKGELVDQRRTGDTDVAQADTPLVVTVEEEE